MKLNYISTKEEAKKELKKMIGVYESFCEITLMLADELVDDEVKSKFCYVKDALDTLQYILNDLVHEGEKMELWSSYNPPISSQMSENHIGKENGKKV